MNEEKREKRRVFFDMDGVLAVFHKDATLEQLYAPGYFRNLEPIHTVVEAVLHLAKDPDLEVCTLSAAFNKTCINDKDAWLDEIIGDQIPKENRFFCIYGENKGKTIHMRDTDVLIDDLSDNLRDFENEGGKAIKLYTDINGTKGTWTGYSVRAAMDPGRLSSQIKAIAMI